MFQFRKKRRVGFFEIETGFALPVGSQVGGTTVEQLGIAIDAHEMKAHVSLAGLDPGHRNHRAAHLAAPRAHGGGTDGGFQLVMARGVVTDAVIPGVRLEGSRSRSKTG